MTKKFKPIDSREQAIRYWVEQYGLTAPPDVQLVREAIREHGVGLCDRANAMVKDKEAAVHYSTMAVAIRDRRRYFLWALRTLYNEAAKARHNHRMARAKTAEAEQRKKERRRG